MTYVMDAVRESRIFDIKIFTTRAFSSGFLFKKKLRNAEDDNSLRKHRTSAFGLSRSQ